MAIPAALPDWARIWLAMNFMATGRVATPRGEPVVADNRNIIVRAVFHGQPAAENVWITAPSAAAGNNAGRTWQHRPASASMERLTSSLEEQTVTFAQPSSTFTLRSVTTNAPTMTFSAPSVTLAAPSSPTTRPSFTFTVASTTCTAPSDVFVNRLHRLRGLVGRTALFHGLRRRARHSDDHAGGLMGPRAGFVGVGHPPAVIRRHHAGVGVRADDLHGRAQDRCADPLIEARPRHVNRALTK